MDKFGKIVDKSEVASWLNALTDKQFIEFFYEYLASRHLHKTEKAYTDSHLVLANAVRLLDERGNWEAWHLELLCPASGEDWIDDAPVCQFGKHCGLDTASWAKNSVCPVCNGKVRGS